VAKKTLQSGLESGFAAADGFWFSIKKRPDFMRYYLFFMGRMEYARLIIVLSSVVDLF
jgi:hypothetical protein